MSVKAHIFLLTMVLCLLAGCGHTEKNYTAVSEPTPRSSAASRSPQEPSLNGEREAPGESAATSEPAGESKASSTLSERAAEIPLAYLETVEQNTQIPPESAAKAAIETLSYGRFYIVYLQTLQNNELHVFENGTYNGVISFPDSASFAEPAIHQFQDHAWLRVDADAGHGMGEASFYRRREFWYEITDPAMSEAFAFTSHLSTSLPYPAVATEYNAKIVDAGPETSDESGDYYCVTLQWDEQIAAGRSGPYDENTPLFSERGAVRYIFHNNTSGKFQFRARSGNDLVFDHGQQNASVITNDTYEESSTPYGRGKRDLLFTYLDRMINLSQTGNERQKRWLHDFLSTFSGLEKVKALYEWNQDYTED